MLSEQVLLTHLAYVSTTDLNPLDPALGPEREQGLGPTDGTEVAARQSQGNYVSQHVVQPVLRCSPQTTSNSMNPIYIEFCHL